MIVRKATSKDFENLRDIKQEFYLWECKRDSRLRSEYVKSIGPRLAKDLKRSKVAFFIAEEKGEIIGYTGGQIERNPAFVRHKKRAHMFNLYVKEAHRGKGVGKKLMNACIGWFDENKIKDRVIFCYAWNKKPLSIYRKKGYKDYLVELTK